MTKPLADRVAIVTGSGRNIGRAIALALAQDGAAVVVNTRSNRAEAESVVREIEHSGGRALAALADVTDPTAVQAMADAALAHFGRIDILVNNAALRAEKHLDEMSYEEWRTVMNVVLDGAFHCVKACLPALRKSGRETGAGRVINLGGLSSHTGSKNRVHVVAAKSGLVGFTRALAHDLGADGITVNCVSPGLINTPRPGAIPQHHQTNRTLTGHEGTPDDVAAVVCFLCSPAARYVTGQVIHASGGAIVT